MRPRPPRQATSTRSPPFARRWASWRASRASSRSVGTSEVRPADAAVQPGGRRPAGQDQGEVGRAGGAEGAAARGPGAAGQGLDLPVNCPASPCASSGRHAGGGGRMRSRPVASAAVETPADGDPSVIAPPVETGSFSGDERLTRAQPGPGQDVARPINVGVVLAADGADHGVLPWPGASGPAGVAVDQRWQGHEHDSPSGAFSLGDKDACELAPASVQDRPVQSRPLRDSRPGASTVPGRFGSCFPRGGLPTRSRRRR